MKSHRPRLSPSMVVAGIALLFALGGSAFALGQKTAAPQPRCKNGAVLGFATVTGIPLKGIENLPGEYTSNPKAFGRKFNCTGRAVQVKHGRDGIFDVRFKGISGASCVAGSVTNQAGSVSCAPLPDGGFEVTLRGIGTINNELPPMNVPFIIVVV